MSVPLKPLKKGQYRKFSDLPIICEECKHLLPIEEFDLKPKGRGRYKVCRTCRASYDDLNDSEAPKK